MKRRQRRPEGCVYRRGKIFWLKWTDAQGATHYRSSGSADRETAEDLLREELKRKAEGSPHRLTHGATGWMIFSKP